MPFDKKFNPVHATNIKKIKLNNAISLVAMLHPFSVNLPVSGYLL
jgi:hypothetical protein